MRRSAGGYPKGSVKGSPPGFIDGLFCPAVHFLENKIQPAKKCSQMAS
jgi:hypothetical protein